MELKTKIHAGDGRHDITITREFDLPVELLFKAHEDREIFEEWMTHEYGKVTAVKHDVKKYGSYIFTNSDLSGNVVFSASGVFHDVIANEKIIRTFEMSNSPFGVQLEFIQFERLGNDTSKLTIHQIFSTGAMRDQLLKLPFAQGLNMAHNRLENVLTKLK